MTKGAIYMARSKKRPTYVAWYENRPVFMAWYDQETCTTGSFETEIYVRYWIWQRDLHTWRDVKKMPTYVAWYLKKTIFVFVVWYKQETYSNGVIDINSALHVVFVYVYKVHMCFYIYDSIGQRDLFTWHHVQRDLFSWRDMKKRPIPMAQLISIARCMRDTIWQRDLFTWHDVKRDLFTRLSIQKRPNYKARNRWKASYVARCKTNLVTWRDMRKRPMYVAWYEKETYFWALYENQMHTLCWTCKKSFHIDLWILLWILSREMTRQEEYNKHFFESKSFFKIAEWNDLYNWGKFI